MRILTTAVHCLALLLMSCQKDFSKKELLDYAFDPENGLYKREEKGGALIEVVYRPNQLIVYQEVKDQNLTGHQMDSIARCFSEIDYFLLRLSGNSHEIENGYAGDFLRFNEINSYLSFEIAKDVFLVQNQDTLYAEDFIRTRTFGTSASTDILFGFKTDLKNNKGKVKFIFDDTKFGTGLNEFHFDISDIRTASSIHLIVKHL